MHTIIDQQTIQTPTRRLHPGARHARTTQRVPSTPRRPAPSGLSPETLRKIVLDLIG
ncbi:hypothetical protein [Stella sp.]|uniref:hypothetical protein n=1 Tax=Stella sp. TaxID=2912054 RepID=UPI0035B076D4